MMRVLRELWLFFGGPYDRAPIAPYLFWKPSRRSSAAAMFLYVARFVDTPQLERALPQGGSYFCLLFVGFVFLDYLNAALDTFDRRPGRDDARFRHPRAFAGHANFAPVFLARFRIYPFAATTLRIIVYLAWGASLFGFPLRAAIGSE